MIINESKEKDTNQRESTKLVKDQSKEKPARKKDILREFRRKELAKKAVASNKTS